MGIKLRDPVEEDSQADAILQRKSENGEDS